MWNLNVISQFPCNKNFNSNEENQRLYNDTRRYGYRLFDLPHMKNRKPATQHILMNTLIHKRKMIKKYGHVDIPPINNGNK